MTRKRLLQTMADMNILPDQTVFAVSNEELMAAIADEIDLEAVSCHELGEILFIVKRNLISFNWQQVVSHSIRHLPFGLSQTGIAWDGHYPCTGCHDAMAFGEACCHRGECKSWEIYEACL